MRQLLASAPYGSAGKKWVFWSRDGRAQGRCRLYGWTYILSDSLGTSPIPILTQGRLYPTCSLARGITNRLRALDWPLPLHLAHLSLKFKFGTDPRSLTHG